MLPGTEGEIRPLHHLDTWTKPNEQHGGTFCFSSAAVSQLTASRLWVLYRALGGIPSLCESQEFSFAPSILLRVSVSHLMCGSEPPAAAGLVLTCRVTRQRGSIRNLSYCWLLCQGPGWRLILRQ